MPPFAFFDEVYKQFDDKEVLRGLTLVIRKGEMLVILGGSGTGKTVILKHIVGLLKPDEGKVYVNGEDITDFDENQLIPIRRKIGFLFQGGALFDSMSVLENVAFPLREHTQLSSRDIVEKVREKLKLVGLESVEKMMPDKLSGGMKKRVALARAIILEPQSLLYDEPTTGLDPVTTRWVTKLIRSIHERLKITSVIVTHNVQSALAVSDRIAFLYRGKIKFVGTPKEISENPDHIVQEFLKG
jgi:phospholipid/cholesterol/gamma-HCH transport system ATP-binding protein